jgi:hypothetical protein
MIDWCVPCRQDSILRCGDQIVEGVPLCKACVAAYSKEAAVLAKVRTWMQDHSSELSPAAKDRIKRYGDTELEDARPPVVKRFCVCGCGGELQGEGNLLPGHTPKVIEAAKVVLPTPRRYREPVAAVAATVHVSDPLAELSALPDEVPDMPKELLEEEGEALRAHSVQDRIKTRNNAVRKPIRAHDLKGYKVFDRKKKEVDMGSSDNYEPLSEAQVQQAMKLHNDGKSSREIAAAMKLPVWKIYQSKAFHAVRGEPNLEKRPSKVNPRARRTHSKALTVQIAKAPAVRAESGGHVQMLSATREYILNEIAKLQKAADALSLAIEAIR